MESTTTPLPQETLMVQEENQRLRRAVEELSILNDLARAIGASVNTQQIIETITRKSLRALKAEQSVVTLIDVETADAGKTLVRQNFSTSAQEKFHLHQNVQGWIMVNNRPLLVNEPETDPRFKGTKWDSSIRNLLCVPLMVKSTLIGVITAYNKKDGLSFTQDDQRLLVIIASQSAQVIENARLYEQEKSLMAMQEQVRLAAEIQRNLLPKKNPELPGYEIYGMTISAHQVGGDLYDFIPIDEHHLAICLGDVTGKGLPASLLMSNVQATLRSQTLLNRTPAECLTNSNRLLFQSTSSEKFCTLFYGMLDIQKHELHYSNAGHDHPFLFSEDGSFRRLSTGGLMLGIFDKIELEEEVVSLHPGDFVFAYSDGIPEAMNANREQFKEEKMIEVLQQHRSTPLPELANQMRAAIKSHVRDSPPSDDVTMVIVKRMK